MSFDSNYLKLRQEREGKTTNNAGGTTPPAPSKEQPVSSGGNSFTSSYLALREKRNNMTISERAAARAKALQKKQLEHDRTPAGILSGYGKNNIGPTTSGGFYSRPTLGSDSEKLYGNVTAMENMLTEKRAALDTAQTSLLQAENDLKTVRGHLDRVRAAYDADPTNENANSYNQIVGAYNLAYDSYASAAKVYAAAYDDYKPYEDQLVDALAVYQLYGSQQKAAFDDWRGTIRDAAAIQTEIAEVDRQMVELEAAEKAAAEAAKRQEQAEYQARQDAKPWYEKLAGFLGGAQDTTLPVAGITPGTVDAAIGQNGQTVSQEMQRLISMKELLQEELNWSRYYYYADFADAPDFAEMSRYVPQERTERRALDIMLGNYSEGASGWEDPLYEYINGNEEAGAYISNAAANQYGSDNPLGALFGRATESKAESQQMTEREVAVFNYLYATQGKDAAHAYYDYLQADLNYRKRKADEEYWAAYAARDPVGSSVFSVAMSPVKSLGYIGQLADWLPDQEFDPNAAYNKFSYIPSAIRGQVVKRIEESGNWGKAGSFAYQTGMSMADFLLNSAISGNNQAVTLTIMGSGAAADATLAAKDRGLSDNQAFALGTIAGILEGGIESMNMETVFKPDALKDGVIWYILKNAASEGTEEVATDMGNLVFDVLIAADQNVLRTSIDSYMRQGMTEGEAVARTFTDQALQMVSDFAGGAVSGGILSGINAGVHVNYTNQMGSELGKLELDENDIQAFIETGLESAPETASHQLAMEMQAKIEAGEALSNYDLARLYQANVQAVQAEEDAGNAQDDTAGEELEDAAGEDMDPGGLQFPTLENDTQTTQAITQNEQNVTQAQETETAAPADAPLSVAERMRQEQATNGGIPYESTYERTAGPAAAQLAGEHDAPGGTGLSDGNAERNAGAGTAEQAELLARGTEQRRSAYADRSRATVARQNYARYLRLEKVSSLDLGLQNGTEARNIQVMPQEHWDAEMSQLADRIYRETGKGVTYVMGRIQIRGSSGAVGYARGVITGDGIIVQADNLRLPMEQIADHEAYHAKADFSGGWLNGEIKRHIIETFSEEQFQRVLDQYIVGLRGVIDVNEAKSAEEFESIVRQIEEEIFADAYAGINAFGAHADQFTEAVNERMDQLYMGKRGSQENGTRLTNGPPEGERYSIETLPDGKKYVRADRQVIFGNDPESWSEQVEDYINGKIRRGKDVQLIAEDGDILTLTATTAGKLADNHTGHGTTMQDEDFFLKSNAAVHIDELAQISERGGTRADKNSRHAEFASKGWNYRTAYFNDFDGKHYRVQISVAQSDNGNVVYNIGRIEERSLPTIYGPSVKDGALGGKTSFEESVPQNGRKVKERLSYDGENASETAQEEELKGLSLPTLEPQEDADGYDGKTLTTENGALPFWTGTREGYPGGNTPSSPSILVRPWNERFSLGDDVEGGGDLGLKLGERFSVDDAQTYDEIDFSNADGSRAGNYVYEGRINAERVLNDIKHYYATGETVQRMDLNQFRYSVDDEGLQQDQKQASAPKKKIRPVAESLPLIAKKDLRSAMLNLFSVPGGQRAELGSLIDGYADRLIKNGELTEADRKAFFDRMYDAGVMVVPADDYKAFARNNIADGRIYVSDRVKADFGDDWADFRRRAFAAGVYLVNDRSAAGIDQWNATLSAEDMLPGLFDSEETDERSILERIIQVAEEGKDEHLSLPEYTRRLAEQEGISEDEFLDNMERQMDWALRTFAEKARLEVHLRDRTGVKIAEERQKASERMTRQKAKEAQRRADERQDRKDMAKRQRDRKELRELQQRTLKQLQWLSKNRNRAPEELKEAWEEVLGDIDLYAVSAADEMRWSDKYNATWKDLAQMYKDAQKNDPNFLPSKELERIVTRLDASKIADMDIGALQDLYKAAIGLRTEFYNRNNVINDEMHRLFAEVYTDAKREIESAPGGFTGNAADKFLNLDQLTPMNVLQRMAGWDPDSAFYSMAKQLERGERDMRAYSVKAQKMLQDFLTEHEDWVKIADGQGKDAIWYELEVPQLLELGMGDKPIFGPTVKVCMTPAQKVHMYLESKNTDNLRHMTGGRTFVDKELYSQGKRQEALSQGRTIRLAPETVKQLVSDLTPEEMELATILDRYYNTFATQEINKVSNILYGYDKAMGKNYAPIYTNKNYTKAEFGVFDATAEGVGNLKGRQYAVNPSYNISAFDAFERHVDQTARFCGMAIPARNWTTLMNWREQNNSTGDVITHKWGEEGKRYITDLITTLQGGSDAKADTISSGLSKLQSNYISAVFGANPSIVLKQLGSIPLAGAYLDARNMPTPAQIAKIDCSLIAKYTQELEWRTMGYTTPETKQLKENPNWTQTNKAFKFLFGGGAITAMDGWAASTLWPWAENKVRREHPELDVGTQAQIDAGESAFYKKVAEEFDNAVSRSQSVSDEIHQGTLRKSKNPITRTFTMFRSDSAQTYNALRQKIGEARYYMRIGAQDKVIQTAKKAAGTAFVAMLLNAAWSEAVSFLMALWKNKGKYYRDDKDELTFQSVVGEMVSNMLGSFAGVVTGGEEVFEIIGNIITGDTWYGIETTGMEQLNDLLDTLIESGSDMRDLAAGGWDVLKNGGNLGEYFGKHSGQILGGIKNLAKAAATYLPGLPVSNLEAYLLGAVKWISPKLGAAYDDLFSDIGKSDLAGMEGSALEGRVGRILSDRNISRSDDTAAALAALYEAGYKTAIPSDTPSSVSINGEKQSLRAYQQQAYDTIWGGIVADALDGMVASESFATAEPEIQAKMLSNLYAYAAERAKAELFDEYEMSSGTDKNVAIVEAGATIAECITWNTITSDMKSAEKSAELASWDLPESVKREIFLNKISDSREDSIAAFREAGLSFNQFLRAYSVYGQINNENLKAGMKAVEFSHWVNAQGYTAEQAAVVKDELTYFSMTPASSSRYDELVESGMDPDDAYNLTGALSELQPEDGGDKVSDLQKWRASVDFSDDVDDQLAALSVAMDPAQFLKVEIANDFGVSPDAYVTLQEIKPQYDTDGNEAYKSSEIQAAVDGLPGYYTTEQKAVLWQLATGSTSSKNNPYSQKVGQQVLDAKADAKETAAQEQAEAQEGSTDDDSFSQALLDQLLGRG